MPAQALASSDGGADQASLAGSRLHLSLSDSDEFVDVQVVHGVLGPDRR